MITPEHDEFMFKEDSEWNFTETKSFFWCYPEENLCGGFYLITRPKVGVCACDVTVIDRIDPEWGNQLYVDDQQHLPCPKSLLEYSLPNGLFVKAIEPLKHYHVKYEGFENTSFDLDYQALMHPFDLNDPDTDPMVKIRNIGKDWKGWGSGHFDTTWHVIGKATIRGRHYNIDCVDTGDRTWGVRSEGASTSVNWLHVHFGTEFAIHVLSAPGCAEWKGLGPLMSGYVLENGKTYGLTGLEGDDERQGLLVMGGDFTVTDVRGKVFRVIFSARNATVWAPCPTVPYIQSFLRATCNGKIGDGIYQKVIPRAIMTRHRDDFRRGTPPAAK